MRAVAIKALQCGSIPQHIGLIMDGNRRYGRKVHVGNGKGYYLGYETLEEVRSLVCVKYLHQFIFFFLRQKDSTTNHPSRTLTLWMYV